MTGDRRTAFVTGASRGIGKAVAIALAEAGFDVAVTARTVEPGERREHSSTVKSSDTTPLPGSLTETAELIEAMGSRVLVLPADLLDTASLGAAAVTALERWGCVDVVVHNARYIGPGHMDRFVDAPVRVIRDHVEGNFFAPLEMNKIFVPAMIARGRGRIINLTSEAAVADPPGPVGDGGWGISYGASKGAMHRVAGILSQELAVHGILVFNLDPGYTATERIAQDMAKFGFDNTGAPPQVAAAVARWLATEDEAQDFNGQTVVAQEFCAERDLLRGHETSS